MQFFKKSCISIYRQVLVINENNVRRCVRGKKQVYFLEVVLRNMHEVYFYIRIFISKSDNMGFKISTSDLDPQLANCTTVFVSCLLQPQKASTQINKTAHKLNFMVLITSHLPFLLYYNSIKTPILSSFTSTSDLKPPAFTI